MQRISVYISSLLLCFVVNTSIAQKKKPVILPPDSTRWLNGFTMQIDAASIVSSALTNNGSYSREGGIQLDLKHKIFPTFELGSAGMTKISATNNIGFQGSGAFERIGFDFNLRKRKIDSKPTNNLFTAGLRIGRSQFNYNVTNVTINDSYWGGTQTFDYPTQNTTRIWYEIVVGVHVEILKNFFMGWTIRNKNLISQDVPGEVSPWFITGFGQNNVTNWGFNYTLGYHFGSQKKSLKTNKVPVIQKKQPNK
jgi:hypothetical protein